MLQHFCPMAGMKIGDIVNFDMLYNDDNNDCTLVVNTFQKLQS